MSLSFSNNVYAKLDRAEVEYINLTAEAAKLGYLTTFQKTLDTARDNVARIRGKINAIKDTTVSEAIKNEQINRFAGIAQKYLDFYEKIRNDIKSIEANKRNSRAETTPDDIDAMKSFSSARPKWYWASSGDNT